MTYHKLLIDLLGIGAEIYLVMLFYGMFLQLKNIRKLFIAIGFCCFAGMNLLIVGSFQNQILLPLVFAIFAYLLGLYFDGKASSRLLLAIVFTAVAMASETMIGIMQTRILELSIAHIQSNSISYIVGVIGSKLLALFILYAIRFFVAPRYQGLSSHWFNLSLLLLPVQSLLLCFVVQGVTVKEVDSSLIFLSELALLASFLLIAVTTFIISNQIKAMRYQQEYEAAEHRLQAQIAHYSELYAVGQELKAMRHDLKNEIIALSGLLRENRVNEALEYLTRTEARIRATEDVVDTGFPAIDAIVNNKIRKAAENGTPIHYKMIVEDGFYIDQFDMAIVLANALDNAMEAVLKSTGIITDIHAVVSSRTDYITILVENYTSERVDKRLRTTKEDAENHGFGLRQMEIIAKKYDGDLIADFDEESRKFSLRIILRNQATQA